MLEINNNIIITDTLDILKELRSQLELNGVHRFSKFIVTSNNIQTNCPFHKDGQERKPSFGIGIGKSNSGQCNCFGCGWKGPIEEMISNCFGYDDGGLFGIKWLAKNFQSVSVESRLDIDLGLDTKEIKKPTYISDEEYNKFRVYHPYMWKRKMTPEVVEIFDIGYDADTQCITFPIRNVYGEILYLARRSVNTKFFNYPDGVEKPVYGLFELYSSVEVDKVDVCICESMIDAITLWTVGKYAVALNGLGNDLQFQQLRKMPNRKFILATDSDEAGMKARQRIRKNLSTKLITQIVLPEGRKDINDCTELELTNLKEIF